MATFQKIIVSVGGIERAEDSLLITLLEDPKTVNEQIHDVTGCLLANASAVSDRIGWNVTMAGAMRLAAEQSSLLGNRRDGAGAS